MLDRIPDEIKADDTYLYIKWKDGKECKHELLVLRKLCPCATCRGGHGPVNRITGDIKEITLVSWEKVGRYGIQLTWSDYHNDGIYTYNILRDACEKGISFPEDEV